MVVGAQEVVTLDQSLSFNYNASQASLGGMTTQGAFTRTDYQFDLGMPILAYRLGTLNLGGDLGWVKQSYDGASDRALALNTLGVQGSLFPYQPYHIGFDYTHSLNPGLFGNEATKMDSWGLSLLYRGELVQNMKMAYRQGVISGASQGRYSSLGLTEYERYGNTDLSMGGDWQEVTYGNQSPWRSAMVNLHTGTRLAGDWSFNNNFSAFAYQGSNLVQLGSTLMGSSGKWTSVSALDSTYSEISSGSERTLGLSQSLARSWGRISGFSQVGLSTAATSTAGVAPPPAGNLTLGITYKLSQTWSLMGDASGAWTGHRDLASGGSANPGVTRSVHGGLSWGGGLAEQLKHAMFYWSNLRFERFLDENYPPGYLPPEMLQVQMRRRTDHDGSMNFSSDLYQVENNLGHQNWFRVQGGLTLNSGLMLQTIGDLRKDDGFSSPNFAKEDRHLTLYGAQRLGHGSFTFSAGYSHSSLVRLTEADPNVESPLGLPSQAQKPSTYYSLGLNTFIGYVPVGAQVLRNNDAAGLGTTTLLAYTNAGYGKVQFRLAYQRGWRSDGLRTSQITINFLRAFDTIALWGQSN